MYETARHPCVVVHAINDEVEKAMNDWNGTASQQGQWGLDDDFKPPYTQDPPYPGYPQPSVTQPGNYPPPAPAAPGPLVVQQPVYVPYAVPVSVPNTGNGMAITSLVLGIVSAAIGWIPVCGLVALGPAIVGIVLGCLGLKSARYRGLAIAGIILSIIGIALSLVIFL